MERLKGFLLGRGLRKNDARARSFYGEIVRAARQIVRAARQRGFYEKAGVPDTPEGRFELITLHLWLILRRLSALGAPAESLAQDLVDVFFEDMDMSLRESGTGDMGVPPRMKRMAAAFYGRMAAYDKAFGKGSRALEASLQDNLYATSERGGRADLLVGYIKASVARLDAEMHLHEEKRLREGQESTGCLPFAPLSV